MGQKLSILRGGLGQRWDVPFGHDKDVGWCFGVDVTNGDNLLIVIEDIALELAGDNTTENTIHLSTSSWFKKRRATRFVIALPSSDA